MAAVYVDSWNAALAGLMPARVLDALQVARWQRDLAAPSARWRLVEDGSRVVGFAGTGPSRDPIGAGLGELDTIAVTPTEWRLGIGRRLMGAAVADMVNAGYGEAILWTVSGYDRAAAFYAAMGWQASGERRDSGRQLAFRRALVSTGGERD